MATTLEDTTVHPLSDAATNESWRSGKNIHEAAEMLSLRAAPPRDLPQGPLREAKKEFDEAAEALANAERELAEQNAMRHECDRLADEVATKARYVGNDKTRLANAQASVSNFAEDFEHRHANEQRAGWLVVVTRVYDAVISEKLLEVLPAAIEQGEAELAELQAQLAALRKQYGGV